MCLHVLRCFDYLEHLAYVCCLTSEDSELAGSSLTIRFLTQVYVRIFAVEETVSAEFSYKILKNELQALQREEQLTTSVVKRENCEHDGRIKTSNESCRLDGCRNLRVALALMLCHVITGSNFCSIVNAIEGSIDANVIPKFNREGIRTGFIPLNRSKDRTAVFTPELWEEGRNSIETRGCLWEIIPEAEVIGGLFSCVSPG